MSKETALIVNTADCMGCSACEVACKQEHNTSVGPRWIRVNPDAPRIIDGKLQMRYSVNHCLHCKDPGCLAACPSNAITKRRDGTVLIDPELCTGCQACVTGCPIGVMQFNDEKQLAEKCDLCVSRRDRGLNPACADACPTQCVYFGETKDIFEKAGKPALLATYKF